MRARLVALAGAAVLAGGCAPVVHYSDPLGPRFAGTSTPTAAAPGMRVVTFNIKFGRNVPAAVALLKFDPRLRGADVLLLQELHEEAVACIAQALALNYVYYPAVRHPAHGRNFGNAVLSPWPIEDDRKLILPHRGRWRDMARIAVGATVRVRGLPVRVYSLHLETILSLAGRHRRAQAEVVRADAETHPHVIVGGDFNGRKVVEDVFGPAGYRWVTREVGRTIGRFSWDHVAARGFRLRDCASAGTVPDPQRASDHRPVWADLVPDDGALDLACGPAVQSAHEGGLVP